MQTSEMRKMTILFGFEDAGFENSVKNLLRVKGIEATIVARFSKEAVARYIRDNPHTDAVVLMEVFPRRKELSKPQKYTAEEVAQLTGASDVNVILVLSENHKGTGYMRTLFTAGITSAFFQKKGGGARPSDIAALIIQKRTRNAAREYYGIASQKIEYDFIDSVEYAKIYAKYKEGDGSSLLENYIKVCAQLTAQQIADFTKRLPEDDILYLAQFEEFHTLMAMIKKFGYDLKIKRPRKVSIGLTHTQYLIGSDGDRVDIKKMDVAEQPQVYSEETDAQRSAVAPDPQLPEDSTMGKKEKHSFFDRFKHKTAKIPEADAEAEVPSVVTAGGAAVAETQDTSERSQKPGEEPAMEDRDNMSQATDGSMTMDAFFSMMGIRGSSAEGEEDSDAVAVGDAGPAQAPTAPAADENGSHVTAADTSCEQVTGGLVGEAQPVCSLADEQSADSTVTDSTVVEAQPASGTAEVRPAGEAAVAQQTGDSAAETQIMIDYVKIQAISGEGSAPVPGTETSQGHEEIAEEVVFDEDDLVSYDDEFIRSGKTGNGTAIIAITFLVIVFVLVFLLYRSEGGLGSVLNFIKGGGSICLGDYWTR